MHHRRTIFVAAVCFTTVLAAVASASLWVWPPAKRPPIDLGTAYVMALRHVGDDARDYYCTGVSIVGNEEQDGKDGAWWLYFSTEDDRELTVYIHMDGRIGNTRDNH